MAILPLQSSLFTDKKIKKQEKAQRHEIDTDLMKVDVEGLEVEVGVVLLYGVLRRWGEIAEVVQTFLQLCDQPAQGPRSTRGHIASRGLSSRIRCCGVVRSSISCLLTVM